MIFAAQDSRCLSKETRIAPPGAAHAYVQASAKGVGACESHMFSTPGAPGPPAFVGFSASSTIDPCQKPGSAGISNVQLRICFCLTRFSG